jgi:hypothetical protein
MQGSNNAFEDRDLAPSTQTTQAPAKKLIFFTLSFASLLLCHPVSMTRGAIVSMICGSGDKLVKPTNDNAKISNGSK